MITKEEKIEIFENTISSLRKKSILDKELLNVREVILDRQAEKFRRLPLD